MAETLGDVRSGGPDGDTLQGSADIDLLSGAAGADVLLGIGAGDALVGGDGADSLRGQDGDDLLFIDRADIQIDGGAGIDTAILAPATAPYNFDVNNLAGIEAIQDADGSDTTITLDARTLASLDDDSFIVSLGDGTDEVRIINFGTDSVSVNGDQVVFDGKVVLTFEGVESLMLTGGADGSTSVVSQSVTSGGANSTTVRTFSNGEGSATTTTSTSITSDQIAPAPATNEEPSAAERAADLVYPADGSPVTDLADIADALVQVLIDYADEADSRREDDAVAQASSSGSLFSNNGLLDDGDLFGLLSRDIVSRLSDADLTSTA